MEVFGNAPTDGMWPVLCAEVLAQGEALRKGAGAVQRRMSKIKLQNSSRRLSAVIGKLGKIAGAPQEQISGLQAKLPSPQRSSKKKKPEENGGEALGDSGDAIVQAENALVPAEPLRDAGVPAQAEGKGDAYKRERGDAPLLSDVIKVVQYALKLPLAGHDKNYVEPNSQTFSNPTFSQNGKLVMRSTSYGKCQWKLPRSIGRFQTGGLTRSSLMHLDEELQLWEESLLKSHTWFRRPRLKLLWATLVLPSALMQRKAARTSERR